MTETCPCGQPAQVAEDHVCGECSDHCRLEAYRRAEARRRQAEQAREDARLTRLRGRRVNVAA